MLQQNEQTKKKDPRAASRSFCVSEVMQPRQFQQYIDGSRGNAVPTFWGLTSLRPLSATSASGISAHIRAADNDLFLSIRPLSPPYLPLRINAPIQSHDHVRSLPPPTHPGPSPSIRLSPWRLTRDVTDRKRGDCNKSVW